MKKIKKDKSIVVKGTWITNPTKQQMERMIDRTQRIKQKNQFLTLKDR